VTLILTLVHHRREKGVRHLDMRALALPNSVQVGETKANHATPVPRPPAVVFTVAIVYACTSVREVL
jgi:hypothetical protein